MSSLLVLYRLLFRILRLTIQNTLRQHSLSIRRIVFWSPFIFGILNTEKERKKGIYFWKKFLETPNRKSSSPFCRKYWHSMQILGKSHRKLSLVRFIHVSRHWMLISFMPLFRLLLKALSELDFYFYFCFRILLHPVWTSIDVESLKSIRYNIADEKWNPFRMKRANKTKYLRKLSRFQRADSYYGVTFYLTSLI